MRAVAFATAATLLCAWTGTADAESLGEMFKGANQAYFRGDYGEAIEAYERLVAAGVEDADVYFNLATAYARAGRLGHTILNFERCLRIAPSDPEAEEGLAAARKALGRRLADRDGEATVRTRPPLREALVRPFGENQLALATLCCTALLFGTLLVRRGTKSETWRLGLGITAALLVLFSSVSGLALGFKARLWSDGAPAVVLTDTELMEGPDARARTRESVPEGTSARVVAREGEFARVRVSGGGDGWLRDSDVGVIAQD